MKAQVLRAPGPAGERPLEPAEIPVPEPGAGQMRIKVAACGACRADVTAFPLREASEVLLAVKQSRVSGDAVLLP